MLTDIQSMRVPITLGGKELFLRYSLLSQLYLEHYYGNVDVFLDKDTDTWQVADTIHMLRAGLIECYFAENEGAINRRDWDAVKPSFAGMGNLVEMTGVTQITQTILEALLASLPPLVREVDPNFQNGASLTTAGSDAGTAT